MTKCDISSIICTSYGSIINAKKPQSFEYQYHIKPLPQVKKTVQKFLCHHSTSIYSKQLGYSNNCLYSLTHYN